MDEAGGPAAYGFSQRFEALATGWTTFPRHYLLYASDGAFTLEVAEARWLLPPQRAAWIAADTPIRVGARAPVSCASVLFDPAALPPPPLPCQVFAVTPLAREMFLRSTRWGRERAPDPAADRFLMALADVCRELAAAPDELWLPRGRSPELTAAMDFALADLASPIQIEDAARAASVSPRTLARRFEREAGMTWGAFLRRARMIAAMEQIAAGASITETALAVGFDSLSAFSTAFRRFAGERPAEYRARLTPR